MTATATTTQRRVGTHISQRALLVLAFVVSLLEGYDLACYGVTVPSLMADPQLAFDPGVAGLIGSLTAFGMLLGAAFSGATTHRVGPRRLIIGSVVVFSIGMVLSALAPSSAVFGIGRALVGIGLGIVLPTLLGYVADLSVPARRNRNIGIVMSGYAFGGLSAPLIGAALLPDNSIRWIYVIGVVPALLVLPFVIRLFPESPVHLVRTGRDETADVLTTTMGIPMPVLSDEKAKGSALGLGPLFKPGIRMATILFWLTSACGLLLVFGISTWLPTIMQKAGYELGSALLLTAVMWTGAGLGMVIGGRIADIVGPKLVVVTAFLVGAASLAFMAMQPNVGVLLLLMFISGFGFIGSQALVNSFILSRYPDDLRGTGLTWSLSAGRPGAMIGPLLGAWVLTSGLAMEWNFYVFAIVGVIGALLALSIPKIRQRG